MNKIFKAIVALGIISVTAFGAAGCSSKTKDVMAKDKLVLGFDDTFVPMGFKDDKGDVVGFDIDLAKEVSKKIGKEITFQPIDWSMKESELNSGKIDFIWNGYSITKEREEKVSFTKPYLDNRQVIITIAESNIDSKTDLKGKKVGAQNQSSAVDAINKEADVLKSFKDGKVYTFETNNDALMDLEAKRIDAVVADEILARYYINAKGKEKYKVLKDDFGSEAYGVGVRKSDTALLNKINQAFSDMKKDGTAKKISEKWFGEDIVK
ncbi:amino acid ABC transporter substrate-binding protein [Clostridium swellfunianum]|uniref:amino acid ABC transporter substrate-binding protein n=1 Tax=Clostridium swellfunianum TaxID=1367462 RepID=UPI00202F1E92|nr:amino acid ABC transporter substrate-binding protein [Clostridium swellfunianum]MCM0647710.1 amino acid ABC transporter substrate-binding protein [Clostridium swellfunianum]